MAFQLRQLVALEVYQRATVEAFEMKMKLTASAEIRVLIYEIVDAARLESAKNPRFAEITDDPVKRA